MSNDLLEKPSAGNEYDDEASWYRGAGSDDPKGDELEQAYNAPSAEDGDLPEGHPSKKQKEFDGSGLANLEQGGASLGKKPAMLRNEGAGGPLYSGSGLGSLGSATPAGRLAKIAFAIKKNKGKSAGVGGLLITVVIILMSFLGGAFELIHVRENLLGNSPFSRAQTASLRRRQGKMIGNIIRKLTKPDFRLAMGNEKFADEFRKRGFDVEYTDGKLTRFGYKDRNFDLSASDRKTTKAATKEFFDGDLGREISSKLDEAVSAKTSLFKGTRARGLYSALKTNLLNWVDIGRARAGPEASPEELQQKVISEMAINDGSPTGGVQEGGVRRSAADIDAENQVTGPDGEPITDQPRSSVTDLPDATNDPLSTLNESGLDDAARRAVNEGTQEAVNDLASTAVRAGFKGAITSAAKSFLSPTELANLACRLKGAAQYVGSLRNVLLAYEVGKLSIRFMTAADHNKAGILSAGGMAILMKYLHSGKGYLSDGGLRFHMGNRSAKPTADAAGMFGLSRKPRGSVGIFLAYADRLGAAKACKVVTNGWFQVGQAILMGGAAIVSGGGINIASAAAQAVPIAIIGAGIEIAVQIGTSIGAKVVKQQVLSGLQTEKGEMAGAGWGSGFGSQSAMLGSVLGNVVTNTNTANTLYNLADQDRAYAMSKRSIFSRYFSMSSHDSLVSTVAYNTNAMRYDIESLPANAIGSIGNLASNPFRALTGSAFAGTIANDYGCDDPQLNKHNIETDPYCNPMIASAPDIDLEKAEETMQKNGMIDSRGKPVPGTEYEKFIKYCLSGRTGILYTEKIDQNGTSEEADDTCTGANLPVLASVPLEEFEESESVDLRPWYVKMLSKKASAATEPVVTERAATTLELFTGWYGYMGDVDDLTESLTGVSLTQSPGSTSTTSTGTATSGEMTLGGYKNPRIQSDPAGITLPGCAFDGTQPAEAVRGEQPGTKEIQRLINDRWGGGSGGILACRGMSTNPNKPSVHGTGRAVDQFYNAYSPEGLSTGNQVLGWLVANSELLGIQYAKFWRVQWSPGRGFSCVTSRDDQAVHSNHVHWETNWLGALRKTPHFNGTPAGNNVITINQELCPRL